jgi:hypothetical protein
MENWLFFWRTYKNWHNREVFKADPAYRLWVEDLQLRHGCSIFTLRTARFLWMEK